MAKDAKVDGLGVTLDDVEINGRKVAGDVAEAVTSAELVRTIDGASTVEMTLRDWERQLLGSDVFRQRSFLLVDDLQFQLVRVGKQGDDLVVTFEDAVVADLRRREGGGSQKPGLTRGKYARRLVASSPGARFRGDTGPETLTTLAVGKNENRWDALVRLADEVQWRVFADKGVVWFAPDDWLRGTRGPAVALQEHTEAVDTVDFDWDHGKKVAEATVTGNARRWALPPGTPAAVSGLGPADAGKWLVGEVRRSLFSTTFEARLVARRPALPEPKPEPVATGGVGVSGPVPTGGIRTIVEAGRYCQSLGFSVGEHPAFGGVHGGHVPNSYHYRGLAIDVNAAAGTSSAEQAKLNALAADLRARCVGIRELIYPGTGDPNHQGHLHLAMGA